MEVATSKSCSQCNCEATSRGESHDISGYFVYYFMGSELYHLQKACFLVRVGVGKEVTAKNREV